MSHAMRVIAQRFDQPCRVLSRSRIIRDIETPRLAFGPMRAVRFNSILVEFGDGFRMITSGNAIRKVKP